MVFGVYAQLQYIVWSFLVTEEDRMIPESIQIIEKTEETAKHIHDLLDLITICELNK